MNATTTPRALHLPDLPEVSVQIGGIEPGSGLDPISEVAATPRPAPALGYRLREALSSYLPLLLMALLAMSTGWLVNHTPQPPAPTPASALRHDPDYTMTGFAITRFGPDGREVLRIAGKVLRHYPATDQLEIEGVQIHAITSDGRTTDARARRALANGDGSEMQLLGGARVISQGKGGEPLELQGEFLHAFLRFERLRSHLPIEVRRGGTVTLAGGLDYDRLAGQLQLLGPVRSTLQPGGRSGAAAASAETAAPGPVKPALVDRPATRPATPPATLPERRQETRP